MKIPCFINSHCFYSQRAKVGSFSPRVEQSVVSGSFRQFLQAPASFPCRVRAPPGNIATPLTSSPAEPTVWVYFRFHPPRGTLDKLLEPSERQFVSSSVAAGVGTTPLQGSCGGQVGEKDLAPFLAQGRGGAVFADALEMRCLCGGVLVTESLLFFGLWALKAMLSFK